NGRYGPIPRTPCPTAPNPPKAGTTPPAAYTVMSSLPPESERIRSAMRSADMPGPGSRLGQEVTMRHFCVCPRAILGAAMTAATVVVEALTSPLRVIFRMVAPLGFRKNSSFQPSPLAERALRRVYRGVRIQFIPSNVHHHC